VEVAPTPFPVVQNSLKIFWKGEGTKGEMGWNDRRKKTRFKVETPIHDNIRDLVTWECKEHGMKS
jgi:hypothetical protein